MEPTLGIDSTLRDAVRAIEEGRKTIAVVVSPGGQVLGTISDGDIRRALLAGQGLESRVDAIMNRTPVCRPATSSDKELLAVLKERGLEALPVVGQDDGCFQRVVHLHELERAPTGGGEGFAAAVIMAGGEGRRLRPLTDKQPKPMIHVGGMPLIERQIRRLASLGVTRAFISVSYMRESIEGHFGDGSEFGIRIDYVREKTRLGTAGALSLLPEHVDGPILVVNGDVLTTVDYHRLLEQHTRLDACVTVAAVQYQVDIPYGVIYVDGELATRLEEKPSQRFLCNAGMYVVSPRALQRVPRERPFDMTELIDSALAEGERISVFPVHEYWTDIGTPDELERAQKQVENIS